MSSLFYINYHNVSGQWLVKRVGEFDADDMPKIYGRFETKAEAEQFIKKEDELLLNNNHNENI